MAQNIYQSGYGSLQEISKAASEDIAEIPGYDAEKAKKLIDSVNEVIKTYADSGKPLPQSELASISRPGNNVDAKSLAEARLKMELSALKAASDREAIPEVQTDEQKIEIAARDELLQIRGVGETTVEQLKAAGVKSLADLLAKSVEEVAAIDGIGQTKAEQLKHDAEIFSKKQ